MDYTQAKNLILTSTVLVLGISGAAVKLGAVELKGMALGTIVSVLISLTFALFDKMGILAEQVDTADEPVPHKAKV